MAVNDLEKTCILLGRGRHYILAISKDQFLKLPDELTSQFTLIDIINDVEIYIAKLNATYTRFKIYDYLIKGDVK